MVSSSILILRELLAKHPAATPDRLQDLYCARLKEEPALIDSALARCFLADMAAIHEEALDGPEAEASWAFDRGEYLQ